MAAGLNRLNTYIVKMQGALKQEAVLGIYGFHLSMPAGGTCEIGSTPQKIAFSVLDSVNRPLWSLQDNSANVKSNHWRL